MSDDELLIALSQATLTGEKPTTAAKRLLAERGGLNPQQLKDRADYLVKLRNKSGK